MSNGTYNPDCEEHAEEMLELERQLEDKDNTPPKPKKRVVIWIFVALVVFWALVALVAYLLGDNSAPYGAFAHRPNLANLC